MGGLRLLLLSIYGLQKPTEKLPCQLSHFLAGSPAMHAAGLSAPASTSWGHSTPQLVPPVGLEVAVRLIIRRGTELKCCVFFQPGCASPPPRSSLSVPLLVQDSALPNPSRISEFRYRRGSHATPPQHYRLFLCKEKPPVVLSGRKTEFIRSDSCHYPDAYR